MTDTQIAWVSGLFEGEGCIHIRKKQRGLILSLCSTDIDIVQRLQELVGGKFALKTRNTVPEHWKPIYDWKLHANEQTKALLLKMLPFFGERRAYTALNALDHLDGI